MMASGVPLKIVSDILGHASVAITGDIYGHLSQMYHARQRPNSRSHWASRGVRPWRSLMAVRPNLEAFQDDGASISWVLTRSDGGGSKQTRTADPLLVRHRQRVHDRPRTSDFPCR
jgi:hypothetical protein